MQCLGKDDCDGPCSSSNVCVPVRALFLRGGAAWLRLAACFPNLFSRPQCTANKDCTRDYPKCKTSTGECVGCLRDRDCPGIRKCDTTVFNECLQCNSDLNCKAPTPKCNQDKMCVECTSDNDCSNGKRCIFFNCVVCP